MAAVQNTHVYMYKDGGGEQWGIGSNRTTVTEETKEKISAIDSRLMESCIGWLGEGGGGTRLHSKLPGWKEKHIRVT